MNNGVIGTVARAALAIRWDFFIVLKINSELRYRSLYMGNTKYTYIIIGGNTPATHSRHFEFSLLNFVARIGAYGKLFIADNNERAFPFVRIVNDSVRELDAAVWRQFSGHFRVLKLVKKIINRSRELFILKFTCLLLPLAFKVANSSVTVLLHIIQPRSQSLSDRMYSKFKAILSCISCKS